MEKIFDIVIIGTGFAGLGMAIQLKKAGLNDFIVLERAAGVGGVWRDNTYPGCACDVESHVYSFSFAPYAKWTRMFAGQREIQAYLTECAERFKVMPHIRFEHALVDARWDAPASLWRLKTTQGDFSARALISGMGALAEPAKPRLPGLEQFAGRVFHSARWDHSFELAGKNVAVVGTGASAIQFVPEIQPKVAELFVFQRTAPWLVPRLDRPLTELEKERCARVPLYQFFWRLKLYLLREFWGVFLRRRLFLEHGKKVALRHLNRAVKDPALRAKLTPDYDMGCKRLLISNNYYPALAQSNTTLVTEGITEVRAHSIVTKDGLERQVDAIIFGTGFEVSTLPSTLLIHDEHGQTLRSALGPSPQSLLGTTCAGFPNFFMLQGPNTGLGHNSVVTMIEAQIELVLDALRFIKRQGNIAIVPKRAAIRRFTNYIDRKMAGSVWTDGRCNSWYLDETGRISTLWPASVGTFRRMAKFRRKDYTVVKPERAGQAARRPWNGPLRRNERIQARLLRTLMRLPAFAQVRLSGKRPIAIDGNVLDPQVQLLLSLSERSGVPGLTDLPAAKKRLQMRRDSFVYDSPRAAVGKVEDLEIPAPHGKIGARHYAPVPTPGSAKKKPLLVFLHGGGFALGDLETYDGVCRLFCRRADVHVLSVDYRLAPEHRFPAAHDDATIAYQWAVDHVDSLGADPARIGVGGDSAGANLATVLTQSLVAKGGRIPSLQLLIYPVVDAVTEHPSRRAFASGFLLTKQDMQRFGEQFAAGEDPRDPRLSPLWVANLPKQSPAVVITAAFDPLRDEGEAYAAALAAAGTPMKLIRMPGLIHGFINMIGMSPACLQATMRIADAVKEHWEKP